jgi:hypothetical protein
MKKSISNAVTDMIEASMKLTARAILGRFSGDRPKARTYCLDMADKWPDWRAEYTHLADLVEKLPRADGESHCDCRECRGQK